MLSRKKNDLVLVSMEGIYIGSNTMNYFFTYWWSQPLCVQK